MPKRRYTLNISRRLRTNLSFAHFAFSITIPLINWPFSWPLYNKIDIFQNQMVSAPLNWLARYAFDIRSEITMRESNGKCKNMKKKKKNTQNDVYTRTHILFTMITNRMDVSSTQLLRECVCVYPREEARPNHVHHLLWFEKLNRFSCANVAHLIKMWNAYIECCSHFHNLLTTILCVVESMESHTQRTVLRWKMTRSVCIKSEFYSLFFPTNLRAHNRKSSEWLVWDGNAENDTDRQRPIYTKWMVEASETEWESEM